MAALDTFIAQGGSVVHVPPGNLEVRRISQEYPSHLLKAHPDQRIHYIGFAFNTYAKSGGELLLAVDAKNCLVGAIGLRAVDAGQDAGTLNYLTYIGTLELAPGAGTALLGAAARATHLMGLDEMFGVMGPDSEAFHRHFGAEVFSGYALYRSKAVDLLVQRCDAVNVHPWSGSVDFVFLELAAQQAQATVDAVASGNLSLT